MSELEYFLSVKNIEISLYAQARQSQPSTFNPRQYLQSLEIPKQISYVLRGIKRAIPRKLVKISDCRVSGVLKTVPGCLVSRHKYWWIVKSPFSNLNYVLTCLMAE